MDDINSTILLIGGSLIGVVVLHGVWVAWHSRKEPLRFDLDEITDDDELALLRGELPNGGARVVARSAEVEPRIDTPEVGLEAEEASPEEPLVEAVGDPILATAQGSDDATEDDDSEDHLVKMAVEDTVESSPGEVIEDSLEEEPETERREEFLQTLDADGRVEPVLGRIEPVFVAATDTADLLEAGERDGFDQEDTIALEEPDPVEPATAEGMVDTAPTVDQAARADELVDEASDLIGRPNMPRPMQETLDIDSKLPPEISLTPGKSRRLRFNFGGGPSRRSLRTEKAEPAKNASKIERDFIAMWVTARHGGNLKGDEIIEALSRNGMRYTSSKVFCRLDPQDGSEQFQFVNGAEPGTFDIKSMEDLETPRVLFLLTLPGPSNPIAALEDMVEVARDVAMALGADLLDDRRSAISGQTIEHYRNRISDFTRRSLSRRSETS